MTDTPLTAPGESEALMDPEKAERWAEQFHWFYERLAPLYGYKTREASAVPWDQVPITNRQLMIRVAWEVGSQIEAAAAERGGLPVAGGQVSPRPPRRRRGRREVSKPVFGVDRDPGIVADLQPSPCIVSNGIVSVAIPDPGGKSIAYVIDWLAADECLPGCPSLEDAFVDCTCKESTRLVWAKEAILASADIAALHARIAALEAALRRADNQLSNWRHGEDCNVFSERDSDPEDYDPYDADAADPHCDCGMSDVVSPLRALLANEPQP